MVGFTTEKVPKPKLARVEAGRTREVGGVLEPRPLEALARNGFVPPTPEMIMTSCPKFQAPDVPPKVPLKVLVAPGVPVVIMPAALVQSDGPGCRQGVPLAVKPMVSFCVSVPV